MKVFDRDFTTELLIDDKGLSGITYATMLIQLKTCPKCKRYMLKRPRSNSPFPRWVGLNFDAQLKEFGWVEQSSARDEHHCRICENCRLEGKAEFRCALCKELRRSNQMKERFGDLPEYLCVVCYKTVSAEVWGNATKDLEERHRYDFE